MVEIKYDQQNHRVTVTGHAGSGQKGHDLVCASVTTLVLTLAQDIEDLIQRGAAADPVVDIQEGHAELACTAMAGWDAVVQLVFDTLCAGFHGLSEAQPEHVRYGLEIEK